MGLTVLTILLIAIVVGLNIGAAVHYADDPARLNLDREGPHVFFRNDSTLEVNYIRGNKEDGFYLDQELHSISSSVSASSFFVLDSSSFDFKINYDFKIPPTIYKDDSPILAISDIEGGYKAFRDFLIHNQVIDSQLNWTFGKGHLVLLGDFVDRGWSVTQVLWFIYKLEQEAKLQGGTVHYILGNHELKNMQGHFQDVPDKSYAAAAVLSRQIGHLYDTSSFIGRWMSSKNSIEKINGHIFVHGGLHPDLVNTPVSLAELNAIARKQSDHFYYPGSGDSLNQLIRSNRTGLSWYRGYFKDELTQEEINKTLDHFDAKTVVVGHSLQPEVTSLFEGRVIAIDVKHPKDYQKYWPFTKSEGLLILGDKRYRLLNDGSKELL